MWKDNENLELMIRSLGLFKVTLTYVRENESQHRRIDSLIRELEHIQHLQGALNAYVQTNELTSIQGQSGVVVLGHPVIPSSNKQTKYC